MVFMDEIDGYTEGTEPTEENVVSQLASVLEKPVKISMKYGWGWVHVNLENPVCFGVSPDPSLKEVSYRVCNNEVGETDYCTILYAELDAPNIVNNINYFLSIAMMRMFWKTR